MHIIEVKGTVEFDNLTLLNPKIKVFTTTDKAEDKTAVVSISMFNDAYHHVRTIGSFSYLDTWSDDDVEAFVKKWISENIR